VREFISYLKKYTRVLRAEGLRSRPAWVLGALVSAFGLFPAVLQQRIFDVAIPMGDLGALGLILVGLIGAYLIQAAMETLLGFTEARILEQADFKIKGELAHHLLNLPQGFFEQTTLGDIQKVWEDSGKVTECFQILAFTAGRTLFSLICYLPILLAISPLLTFIKLVSFPLGMILNRLFSTKDRSWEQDLWDKGSKLHTSFQEGILGIRTVKAFSGEHSQARIWQGTLLGLRRIGWKRRTWQALWGILSQLINQFSGSFFFLAAAWGLMDGWLSFGSFLAFNTLSGLGLGALQSLVDSLGRLMKNINPLGRFDRVMCLTQESTGKSTSRFPLKLRGEVEFRQVSFSYGSGVPVLEKVQLDISPGTRVGVVGPSGSGKSTLVNLLMGFHKPLVGSVLVDGLGIDSYDRDSLRSSIGLVLQENFFFHRTLRENLLLGRVRSDEEIFDALVRAQALEFLHKIPGRLNALYGSGGLGLSGGQKQRLAIARAFLQDPAILVLDEATSALDTASESAVQQALEELCDHRSSLVIAHRLSTILDADKIYYLRCGRVEGQGAHGELVESCPGYRDLWRIQGGRE